MSDGVFNPFGAGYREIVFLTPEPTYGTPVQPAATDAIQIQTTSFAFTQERVNRADKTTSRSTRERITHRKSVAWSVTAYNLPSGSNGTAPDMTDALEKGFGGKRIVPDTTAHASVACTTTVLALTSGGGATVMVGDGMCFTNLSGDVEVSFVKSIATDAVTIEPPFSSIPATGTTFKGGVKYYLTNVLGQLTATRVLDNIVQVYTGCMVNEIAFAFPGTGEGTVTVTGMAQTEYSSGASALADDLDDSETVAAVVAGTGLRFEPNTRIIINSEGSNTAEVVLITGVSSDNLTIVRAQAGTAACAHATAAVLGPYEPPQTVAGSPISGTIGDFIMSGANGDTRALSTLKVKSADSSISNAGSLRNEQFGTDKASGFFVNKREVKFDMTVWLEPQQAKLYNQSKSFTAQVCVIQLGKTLGSITAHYIPRGEFDIPAIPGGGDDEVSVQFSGVALAGVSTTNSELYVFYA